MEVGWGWSWGGDGWGWGWMGMGMDGDGGEGGMRRESGILRVLFRLLSGGSVIVEQNRAMRVWMPAFTGLRDVTGVQPGAAHAGDGVGRGVRLCGPAAGAGDRRCGRAGAGDRGRRRARRGD